MSSLRKTAYKVWLSDLHNNEFIKKEGEWESDYVKINGKEISRVNIITSVIQKYENDDSNYASLTVEDGSDTIRVKIWGEDIKLIKNIEVGDLILLIGRVRNYNEEIYINPELIKKVDNPNWFLVRKLELLKEYGEPEKKTGINQLNFERNEEINPDNSYIKRQNILNVIERSSSEEGVDKEKIILESNCNKEEADRIIEELLKEGQIYEIKPGRIRLT